VPAERAFAEPVSPQPSLTKTCPSAPAEVGSVVLGVVLAPGQVAYLNPNPPVTPELLDALGENGVPIENRMRFACACREHQCQQWSGGPGNTGHCGLVERAVAALEIDKGLDNLPACGIRATCRWFSQQGRRACAACPEILRRRPDRVNSEERLSAE
jgi:hypothetical protein